MNAQELLDEWTEGESSGVRPHRVKVIRDDLRRHTGLPVPQRVAEIESWLPRMKGQVTKRLREAAEEDNEAPEGDEDADE